MGVVDGLGGGDFPPLADDLGGDAGGEGAVGLQVEGGAAHDGVVDEAEVFFIALADPEDDALGVGEHHVVGEDQVVLGAEDVEEAPEVDVVVKKGGEVGCLRHGGASLLFPLKGGGFYSP